MTKFKRGDLLEIEWDDHVSYRGWATDRECGDEELDRIRSVGYFLNESKARIVIHQSESVPVRTVNDRLVVGRAQVISVRRLRKAKP